MFSQFQSSYRRMEESLQRLTDSIAAYNPSPAAADALHAADDAVNEDLNRRMYICSSHRFSTGLTPSKSIKTPSQPCPHPRAAPHYRIARPEHQRHREASCRCAQGCCCHSRRRQSTKSTSRSRHRRATTIREIYLENNSPAYLPQTDPGGQTTKDVRRAGAGPDHEWHGYSSTRSTG